MKNVISYCGLVCFMVTVLFAQAQSDVIHVPLTKVLNPKEQVYDEWGVVIKNKPVENYFGNEEVDRIIEEKTVLKQSKPGLSKFKTPSNSSVDIEIGTSFRGAPKSGTPSDNGTDISKEGKIVHTINFDIQIQDKTGSVLLKNSLKNFFDGKAGVFDPRVLYDHYEDRFIVVALSSTTKEIVVAFSQTNDPTGKWNLFTHKLNGSIDFPIIAINEHELVVTLVNFGNGAGKFAYQISKKDGYTGKNVRLREYKFDDSSSSIITPADAYGTTEYGNKMYFVGINSRGGKAVTLFQLTDTLGGNPTMTKTQIDLPVEYSTGGMIKQKGSSKDIRVPNERMHKAIYHNGTVYGTFCTDVEKAGFHGLYYSKIDIKNNTGEAYTFTKPKTDLVNPAIALLPIEGKENDMRAVFSYHETNKDMYPTLMAILCDESGEWSTPVVIKEGVGSVGNADRLGDYTSCVTRFDGMPAAWLSGEYGGNGGRDNWIAEIKVAGIIASNDVVSNNSKEVNLGPNPVRENIMISFSLNEDIEAKISLFGLDGKLVKELFDGKLNSGKSELYFNTSCLNKGVYFVKMLDKGNEIVSKKIVKK